MRELGSESCEGGNPMRIRMLETVRPDLPFLAKPGTILTAGEEYEATSNRNGAISGLCENGEYIGVRPGEFVFLDAPDWVRDIWVKEYPAAFSELGSMGSRAR